MKIDLEVKQKRQETVLEVREYRVGTERTRVYFHSSGSAEESFYYCRSSTGREDTTGIMKEHEEEGELEEI
ncbi:hypothetical protein KEM48_006152 [Puccinia striiformis f. sp. tritici PST-130]|nr:hypothetical protein KEM48_006152 [Puccinia striiformis f. sp. tritici PST-130]